MADVSSTPPAYIIGLDLQPDVNPYAAMQQVLINRMYPRVTEYYEVRIGIILAILCYTLIISAIYLATTIHKAKAEGRPIWIARRIERPQGKYIALNQFILYPISTILLSIIWIAYVCTLRRIWYLKQTPVTVYLWGAIIWIPFYCHLWSSTFAVVSGGNLASRGRKPNTHLLSPFVANSLYVLLLPLILALLIGFGIWSGLAWMTFGNLWQEQFDAMGRAALTWYPGSRIDPAIQNAFSYYILIRTTFLKRFQQKQQILLSLFVASCGILLIINIVGGLVLLSSLRRITRFHAESASVPLSDSFGSSSKGTSNASSSYPKSSAAPTSSTTPSTGTQTITTEGLQRLESDITLFFISVPPILLVAIAFYCWAALSLQAIHTSGPLTELATLGIVWIYSFFAALIMTILVVKSRPKNSSILRISHHKEKSTHVVQLQQAQSGDEEKEGHAQAPAKHSHGILPKISRGIPFHVETARTIC